MGSNVSREGINRDLEVFKFHFDIRAFLEIPLGASK
jgi:hypothetical protein